MWNVRPVSGYTVHGPIDVPGPNTEPLAIATWIERTYQRNLRQRRLEKPTPSQLDTINQSTHAV
jgi:hypothetical protein